MHTYTIRHRRDSLFIMYKFFKDINVQMGYPVLLRQGSSTMSDSFIMYKISGINVYICYLIAHLLRVKFFRY